MSNINDLLKALIEIRGLGTEYAVKGDSELVNALVKIEGYIIREIASRIGE